MASDESLSTNPSASFSPDEACAQGLDQADPLKKYRDQFHIPTDGDGRPLIYFAGNSLGVQPKTVAAIVEQELGNWARLGVDGHFEGPRPWYRYYELMRDSGARLVGAKPGEVVMMNTLTVNLHLMMVTFYRPTKARFKILVEDAAFPSDTYALKTQLGYHGFDPTAGLLIARPRDGEHALRTEDIVELIEREADRLALVMMGGVNYYTGQVYDMARITEVAHRHGVTVGFDLAHAAGNVSLDLHDWGVDFAVWCNYKYLNGGPGAVAGCFVHQRHATNTDLQRFGGWWGNDPDTRFRMHLQPDFVPRASADGWQVSNPPILSLAPVKASYDLFDEVGMVRLCAKSRRLTGYLQYLIDSIGSRRFEVITPREAEARGCQLSMFVHDRPRELFASLQGEGVVCDFREPNVIRVAPTPFYNSFQDVWSFAQVLARHDRK